MVCHMDGAKPLSEPMLSYFLLHPKEHVSMKFYLKFKYSCSIKCVWTCLLWNGSYFVQRGDEIKWSTIMSIFVIWIKHDYSLCIFTYQSSFHVKLIFSFSIFLVVVGQLFILSDKGIISHAIQPQVHHHSLVWYNATVGQHFEIFIKNVDCGWRLTVNVAICLCPPSPIIM